MLFLAYVPYMYIDKSLLNILQCPAHKQWSPKPQNFVRKCQIDLKLTVWIFLMFERWNIKLHFFITRPTYICFILAVPGSSYLLLSTKCAQIVTLHEIRWMNKEITRHMKLKINKWYSFKDNENFFLRSQFQIQHST